MAILNLKLMKYQEENSLLNERQCGFRKNRSTGDLMALLTETWNGSIHFFGESNVVALDISKAFDRVWHQSLISKVLVTLLFDGYRIFFIIAEFVL